MSFSTYFQLNKPDYKLLRFDLPLNENFDKIDAGFRHWASGVVPGTSPNYDEIVLTEGIIWRDTSNHLFKGYNGSSWKTFFTEENTHAHDGTSTGGKLAKLSVSSPTLEIFVGNQDTTKTIIVESGGIINFKDQNISTVNASGSNDLTTWCDQIGSTDADDPMYAVQIKVADTTYYIPCFTSI